MSSRLMKKVLKDDIVSSPPDNRDDDDNIEEKETTSQPRKNPFLLLSGQLEDEEEEEEAETDNLQHTPLPSNKPPSTPSNKNKKKKKKKKKKNAASQTPKDQNIEAILKELNNSSGNNNDNRGEIQINNCSNKSSNSSSSNNNNELPPLFKIETNHLLAENELKRLFGAKTLKGDSSGSVQWEKKGKGGRGRNNRVAGLGVKKVARSALKFTKISGPVLQMTQYYSMQLISPADSDIKIFEFIPTKQMEACQLLFMQCVNSGDPQTLVNLLYNHPYHVPTLIQVSDLLKQTGEYQQASELVERALYSLESCWNTEFNWNLPSNNRILYSAPGNKDLFRTLFRQIQMLGRRGCCRTGLEVCKFILAIDPSDPLFIIGTIDYFAIRSKQYQYLLQFVAEFKDRSTFLPNLYYSSALAAFHLSTDSKNNNNNNDDNNKCAVISGEESDRYLQRALITFPLVLLPLLQKCNKFLTNTATGSKLNVEAEPFFSAAYSPPSLSKLASLFIDKNYSLWTDQKIIDWISKNVNILLTKISTGDKSVFSMEDEVRKVYSHNNNNNDSTKPYAPINPAEYNDEVVQIPRELLQDGGEGAAGEVPVRRAATNNPLALFLSTLLPWNAVPNAPFQESESQNILQQLEHIFGVNLSRNNNSNNEEEEEEDFDDDEDEDGDDDYVD